MPASVLYLHIKNDNNGRLRINVYDKRDDFNFPIVNFPFIFSNIPAGLHMEYTFRISYVIQEFVFH